MSEAVVVFHPSLDDEAVLRVMQYEDLVYAPNGPVLRFAGHCDDAWGRRVLLFHGGDDLVANLVICHLTRLRFAQIRGPLADNVAALITAAQTAADQPRFPLAALLDFAAHADNERDRVQAATVLAVAAPTWDDDVARAVGALLADGDTRVAVAERLAYRCPLQLVELLEQVAATDADPPRRAALERYAQAFRAVAGTAPPPDAADDPFLRRLLELGPPGAQFVTALAAPPR